MKGIQSSRSILQAAQRTPRYSRSLPISISRVPQVPAAIARLISTTFKLKTDQAARGPVQYRRAARDFTRGAIALQAGEFFYLVESAKFAGRFYVLVERAGGWQCSSAEDAVKAKCLKAIQAA